MTEQDAVTKYLELRKRRDEVVRELKAIGDFFSVLARALATTSIRLMLSNTGGTEFGAPPEIALDKTVPSLDFQRWPDKVRIAQLLKEYYDLDFQCRNAYHAIPERDRGLISKP